MLLKESESNGSSGRETLSAIRVDLRRIWALKREVELLEASLKEEAGLLRMSLIVKVGPCRFMERICYPRALCMQNS